jgi:predicted MPP superfamily phosphohydrolase
VVTDITISFCSKVNPLSTCKLNPDKWQRVNKDLFLGSSWTQTAWLHVERKKEEWLTPEDEVIIGVQISKSNPGLSRTANPKQVEEQWESRPGGIWILRSNKRHDAESDRAVTAVDVLFGPDAIDPRGNWVMLPGALLIDSTLPAKLSIRHGRPETHTRESVAPRVNRDGKFKILQISDAHLSTGLGVCRDAIGENGKEIKNCDADPRTLEFIESILDDEKPDMVVLSGDQTEGPAAHDTESTIFKMTTPLIERKIPWAAIFGNHDEEGAHSLRRPAQMKIMEHLPYSLSEAGPEKVDGVGNYYVEVLAPSPSHHSAITLYLFDTHSLSPDDKHYPGYAWVKQNQIDWFRNTANGLKKNHDRYSHIHLDLAFIHIPLPEYDITGNIEIGGAHKERVTAPGFNTHLYDAFAEEGIVAVGCGHDHANDYCALRPQQASTPRLGPWMCFAGASGFGGYGGYGGIHRRVRVWEADTNAGRIMTWKRLECCGDEKHKRVDEVVLVEGGVAVTS